MIRRRALKRYTGDRALPREEQIARALCEKLNDAGCVCRTGRAPSTCSRMILVAKHAIRLVEQDGARS